MTMPDRFEREFGFRRDAVTLANWRTGPFNRWSFQNVEELVPSAVIAPADDLREKPQIDATALLGEKVSVGGADETVAAFLARSSADALCLMKNGRFMGDWTAPHMRFGARHLVFSISKSLTAIVAGILQGDGLLDLEAPVTDYLPEAKGSVYGDATVRHVLDMTVSLDFEEAYLDPESDFARYRKAMLWNPGGGEEGLAGFLMTLRKLKRPHGEVFSYCSPNSDLLGVLVERASGVRFATLMSDRLWRPLGAHGAGFVTVDRAGAPRTAGGISVTPRDLARVGEMMRQGGTMGGARIVPEAFVHDTARTGGDAAAWLKGDLRHLFPGGRYRNKWYQSGDGVFCGIGIHGQWLFVDEEAGTVIAKVSSQPEPVDDQLELDNIAFLRQLGRML